MQMTSILYGEEPESSPIVTTEMILVLAAFFFGVGIGQML